MQSDRFNEKLRSIFQKLINDGFSKTDVANVSLGATRIDQLNGFLSGTNLGIKPLVKIFNLMGYTLHLVPIVKKDQNLEKKINEITFKGFDSIEWLLFDYLQKKMNEQLQTRKSSTTIMLEYAIDTCAKNGIK